MPAAPKEKTSPTSREKGKGKERDLDGGGKDKEPKQRKKPGRVPTSCAECRRLKLRCDRNVPCAKCVSRGCGSICPDGTLAPGKGNRLVLANTEELHARIDGMADRNRALEKALADLYSQSREGQGGSVHPLLVEGRLELGDLGRLSVAGAGTGLGGTSESSRSSLMVPTPSPRASTSASTNSPSSQTHSHSQSRSPAPERQAQASASTSQSRRWRAVPGPTPLLRPDGDDRMEMDLDLEEGHEKDGDELLETDDVDDEGLLHNLSAKGTLFVSDGDLSLSKGGSGGGGSGERASYYYYLGRSARPEFLAQITPLASTPPTFSSLAKIRAILPERDVALSLCDVYLAYGTSVYASITSRAELEEIMRGVYRAIEHSVPSSSSSSLLCDTAFLLAVFALGALFSPALAAYSDEARTYYAASQAALDMLSREADAGNETALHALLHLTQFASHVSSATSSTLSVASIASSVAVTPHRTASTNSSEIYDADAGWTHAGRGVRLAQRMGLHMHISSSQLSASISPSSSHRPGMSEDVRKRRDSLWWALFVVDTWTSFELGRPPAVSSRAYVNCDVPPNRALPSHVDLVAADSDSIFHSWYLHFTLLLHDALDIIVVGHQRSTSSTAAYSSVLEHDRRIRDFYVPRAWRMSSSASVPGAERQAPTHGHDDRFGEQDEDDRDRIEEDTEDPAYHTSSSGRKQDEDEMYRWLVLAAKETVLLKLHQSYLIYSLSAPDRSTSSANDDNDDEEGEGTALRRSSQYLPSVLAVYRSVRRLTSGLSHTWATIPRFLARVGAAWSHGLSAAVAAALISTRIPDSDSELARGALDALAALVEVFGAAAPLCLPAANMLNLIRNLHQTAAQAHSTRRYHGGSDYKPLNGISPMELERLNGQTAFLLERPNLNSPSASHYNTSFEQPSSSSSSVYVLPQQSSFKTYDHERHEPRLRSRATSATMSDFATDMHYNHPHTLMHHNTHRTHHERHTPRPYKLSPLIMQKLHPTLAQDVRLFEDKGSLSNVEVAFHDTSSGPSANFTPKERTPQRQKILEPAIPFSPHDVPSTAASQPPLTYHHLQQEGPSYRNPTPNQTHHPRPSGVQSPFSENREQYHSQRVSPNPPPRFIADPYMPSKPHSATSTLSSMQYPDDNYPPPRGHDTYTGSHSHSFSQAHTQTHDMLGYSASSIPPSGNMYNARHQREPTGYHYPPAAMDEDDLSSANTSDFYTSESHMRVGGSGHSTGGHGSGVGGAGGGSSSSATMTTTTTTTATMSSTGAAFMPYQFVLGPLPNGFQSGFFPPGFSSALFPSPVILDPTWNGFVEQLGFCP